MRKREWARLFKGYMTNGEKVETDKSLGTYYMSAYIGTVFSIMPSGKFHMPWSSNVTEGEANRDAAELERMESAASALGAWIENGEGDPCDMFLCWNCPEFQLNHILKEQIRYMEYFREAYIRAGHDDLRYTHAYQQFLSLILSECGLMDERN